MKIAVLGGAGDMGSLTVEDLARTEDVAQVTILDHNVEAAERVRARVGGTARIEVRKVDAHDHASLVAALRGHDAAASALGPFYKFEAACMRAAIEARVPYASICDDWIACESVLEELQAPARDAGVVCITGVGASPGLTNMMAVRLAEGMDSVKRIDVNVFQPWNAGGGEAVLRHLLFIVSGEIAAYQQGRASRARACSEQVEVAMPQYGTRTLYNLGHSEPVSLPRHFPGLETCNFYMGLGRGMRAFVAAARRGWFESEKNVERALRLVAPFESYLSGDNPGLSSIRVDVWGREGAEDVHRMACGLGAMRDGTGLALSVGTLMLARGALTVEEGGVYAPESCIAQEPFIADMRSRGMLAFQDLAMTQPLE